MKLSDFNTVEKVNRLLTGNRKRTINGLTIDKTKNETFFNIMKGTQILVDEGMATFENDEQTVNRAAISLLFSLGCVPSDQSESYSLISTQTDNEIVANEDIFNPSDYTRQKLNIKIDDKFPNSQDPIYEMDEQMPEMVVNQIRKITDLYVEPNVEMIASNFIDYNLTSMNKKLKYFK